LPMRYKFMCITDRTENIRGVDSYVETRLPGWWAKMELFNPAARPNGRIVYFDLDTVICDDLTPLAMWGGTFGICENFTKLAGSNSGGCNYGSCVMSLDHGFGSDIWNQFDPSRVGDFPRGDQQAIESFYPYATFLQRAMPDNFFLGYRHLTVKKPDGCAVVVFAGANKPHNSQHGWIKDAWQ